MDRSRLGLLREELEWRRCTRDPAYFLERYWHIKHPARGRILFELRQAQRAGLKHWEKHRYSLTLKARQIGWSTLVAAYQFWLCFFHEGRYVIDLSRTEREAVKLLAKTKYGWKHLAPWLKERGPKLVSETLQKMEWSNDSAIESLPSASDPARGESVSLIVVDEWAFLPNPEEAWASIEPVADVGGRVIGLSTANGWGNFFHTMWVGAQTGTNGFKPLFFPWSANTDRDQEWYESKKRTMLPWQLAQEYPSNPDEAFIQSGHLVMDLDVLREKVEPHLLPPTRGYFQRLPTIHQFQWRPSSSHLDDDEPLAVWELPVAGRAYALGADVAEGLDYGDYSSAHVIDAETGEVVAHWHGHIPADEFGEELWMLGHWYNTALIGCESNNHGLTTLTRLRQLNYPRLYRRRRLNTTKSGPSLEFGWATTRITKPLMIDELAAAIKQDELVVRCEQTLAELRTYVRDERGRMSGSPHDDRVVSLAIANQMLKHVHAPEYRTEQSDYWTFDWWARQGKQPDSLEWRIGEHNLRRPARL